MIAMRFANCRLRLAVVVTAALASFALEALSQSSHGAAEPLGPSSRRTGVVISEIMYHPAARADNRILEFVELYNSNPFFEQIGGYRLSGQIDFTFPSNSMVPAHGFVVVARSPADVEAVYGISGVLSYAHTNYSTNVVSGMTNVVTNIVSLANGNLLNLLDRQGAVLLSVPYSNKRPWPTEADGTGHSLVLGRPSYGEGNPLAWSASDVKGGSPGARESATFEPLRGVVINEFLANVTAPLQQFIELYNGATQQVDLSGAYLSDSASTNKFRIPAVTRIAPGGFTAFQRSSLGFSFSGVSGALFLVNSNNSRVIDAVAYDGQANGLSTGRVPDGGAELFALASPTPAARNSGSYEAEVVINEIMYNPPSGLADDEFVELYNRSSTTVSLLDWGLTGGIDFGFPSNAVILPNSYLAVCRNVTNLAARYPRTLNCTNAVGNYLGKLGNSGDRVALTKPVQVITTNSSGQFKTNTGAFVVDEVTYGVGGRWGGSGWSHGGGSSLELIDARANRRLPLSWGDSEISTNISWPSVRIESTPIEGDAAGTADLLQILLTGEGECLVDNVEVVRDGGANLVANATFESGFDGWIAQGNHIRSTLETNLGYQSSQSLHIRASGPGDTIANHVSTRLTAPLRAGDVASIRARVRWLRGRPNILLRLRGNYLEARGLPRLPLNQGTPGARNSRALTNGPPLITDLLHAPALPQGSQAVTVTARVEDPDGVSSVLLKYRLDPAMSYSSVTVADDGAGPDLLAGDGIYTGTIPGQPGGTLVAFYVEATDGFNPPAKSTFPNDAPARECLVRFGDPVSTNEFGSYRFWITQSNLNRWINQPGAGLEPVDGTFIYGDRRIIYNVLGSYAAESLPPSYDSPLGTPCDYAFRIPADDPLLGTTEFNKIQAPGSIPGDDATLQRGQTAAWMAVQEGVRAGYRRYVNFFFNGVRRGTLLEDAQIPGADVIDEWFDGDTDGTLFALQPWIELADSGGVTNYRWCTLTKFVDFEERLYRWNWSPRVTKDSTASFTSLFALIEAADFGFLSEVADTAGWTRLLALQHAVGNRNSFGDLNSYNSFAWLPDHGPWELLPGEFNTVLGAAGSDGPTGDDLLQHLSTDGSLDGLYSEPVSIRSYWRAIRDLANGPMAGGTVGSMLDAKFSAFQAAGLSVSSPASIKSWLADRRTYLLSQLAPFDISFGILGTNRFTTNEDWVVIRGTAPLDVDTITLNGQENAVIWETPTNWAVNLFLEKGSNHFVIQGEQQAPSPSTNSATIDVTYTLDLVPPQGYVVINEIMYHPAVSGGSFLELFNASSQYSFDLSNWRFQGIDFTFPAGTVLRHGAFLLVVEDRNVFSSIYGEGLPVAGEFGGHLSNNGETITLYIPGPSLSKDVIVDQVHYEPRQPWPTLADGTGASLQLIDPQQDNSRVSNWSVYAPGVDPPIAALPTPGATNGTLDSLPPFPLLWLNEIQPQNLNSITDSAGERDPWLELFNSGTNSLILSNFFLSDNFTNLLSWQFPAGVAINPGQLLIVWIDGQPSQGTSTEFHTSFRATPTNGQIVLSRIVSGHPQILDYLKYSGILGGQSYGCYPDGQGAAREILLDATPAASNNVPPHIYVNEWMASNTGTLEDPVDGDTEDWIELFNATYHAIDLSGWFMTDNLTNKNQWQFPVGARISGRGFLLIWADGEPEQNNPLLADLHANFQLSKSGEAIGLYRPDLSRMDSVTFGAQMNDVSQGRYPDGSGNIELMSVPTPRQPNFVAPTYPLPPPIIASPGDVVTFTLSDPTVPPYTLVFELGPDAPPDATLDPYTGVFRWVLPLNQPPGTYAFTIKICDLRPGHFPSIIPITIVVKLPFRITTITRTNNDIWLTWNSVTGQTYRVQFIPDLTNTAWSDATTESLASGTTLTVTLPGRTNRQEFYRAVQSP